MLIDFYNKSLDSIKQWFENIHQTELTPIPVKLRTNNSEHSRSKRISQYQLLKQRHGR